MGGGKPSLLYEWPAVIEEEDKQVSLRKMIGMAEQLDLVEHNQSALSLYFKEIRERRQKEEGTDNV